MVNSSLVNGTISTVVAIGTTQTGTDCHSAFTTWNNSSGNNIRTGTCNKAPNGLWYDNCEGRIQNWSSASSYCSSKGMRLPEVSAVPSCSSYTWSNSEDYDSYMSYWAWNGNSKISYSYTLGYNYVRCVK